MAVNVTFQNQAETIGTIDQTLTDLRGVRALLPIGAPERREQAAGMLERLGEELKEAAGWLRGKAQVTSPDVGLSMAILEREFPVYAVRRLPSGAVCATARCLATRPWCVAGTVHEVRVALRERR